MNNAQQRTVKEAARKLRAKAASKRHEAEQLEKQADQLEGKNGEGYQPLEDED